MLKTLCKRRVPDTYYPLSVAVIIKYQFILSDSAMTATIVWNQQLTPHRLMSTSSLMFYMHFTNPTKYLSDMELTHVRTITGNWCGANRRYELYKWPTAADWPLYCGGHLYSANKRRQFFHPGQPCAVAARWWFAQFSFGCHGWSVAWPKKASQVYERVSDTRHRLGDWFLFCLQWPPDMFLQDPYMGIAERCKRNTTVTDGRCA